MRYALAAGDATVCLSETWHAAVISDKERTACLLVVLCLLTLGNVTLIYTFIIM